MTLSTDSVCTLLQGCIQNRDLIAGRSLHSVIISNGFCNINIISDHVIRLFTSCERLFEANLVFCNIKCPTVFSWEAIISTYATLGQQEAAFRLYHAMRDEGINPNRCIFFTLLKSCGGEGKGLVKGRFIHEEVMRTGFDSDRGVVNTLLDMYAKSGSLEEARKLFDNHSDRDVVSFGAMIVGYTLHGHGLLALELFEKMEKDDLRPDKVTFLTILKACSSEVAIREGRLIHHEILRNGLQSDLLVGSSLVDMYAKSGSLEEAENVFYFLPGQTVVSWDALISGYVLHGQGEIALKVYESMLMSGIRPDKVTFLSALKACGSSKDIDAGRFLHDQVLKKNYVLDTRIGSALIDMYGNCGELDEARRVFDSFSRGDVVMWSALMGAYAQHGFGDVALEIFQEMQENDKVPNHATYIILFKACGSVRGITHGRFLHNQAIRDGVASDNIVGSAIVDMYCKCGSLQEASRVFEGIRNQDVVSWCSMIAGYSQHGFGLAALSLFERMQKKGLKPSSFVFSSALKACASIGALEEARLIHDQIVRTACESDAVIGNTLVDMYSSCESLEEARHIFDQVLCLDMVSWNAMITGYTRHRCSIAALELFDRMQQQDMEPDTITYSCVVKACGTVGAISVGRILHHLVLKSRMEGDVVVGTNLIDMYGTCGALSEARRLFDLLPGRNLVSWSALIAGYTLHEKWDLALGCVKEMQSKGVEPDDRIHTLMLTAFSHLGEVKEGCHYLRSIEGDAGSLRHINCMIDLYGRSGRLVEATELLKTMPSLCDVAGWMSVLTACKTFKNAETGGHCLDQIADMDRNLPAAFMFMSDIYADMDLPNNIRSVQSMKRFVNAWKRPARACVDIGDEVHELVVGDEACTPDSDVTIKVERLAKLMGASGYTPNLQVVLQPSLKESLKDQELLHLHGMPQKTR